MLTYTHMPYLFLILSVVFVGLGKIYFKKSVHVSSVYTTAIFTQFIGGAISLVLFFINGGSINQIFDIGDYKILTLAILLWTIISIVSLLGVKATQVSIREVVNQVRTPLTVFLGIVFLSEVATTKDILGILLIFTGIVFAVFKGFKKENYSGIMLVIFGAILIAVVSLFDKIMTGNMDASLYSAYVFIVPGIILLAFLNKQRISEIKTAIKTKEMRNPLLIATVIGSLGYIFLLYAYKGIPLFIAYPISQLNIIFAMLGGIIILKEKDRVPRKIIGILITILGAILIKL